MPHYTIDRFEGTEWAVLEDHQGKTFLVPRRWLPTPAREGAVLIATAQPPDDETVSLTFQLDHVATEERFARLKALSAQLPHGPQGDVKV